MSQKQIQETAEPPVSRARDSDLLAAARSYAGQVRGGVVLSTYNLARFIDEIAAELEETRDAMRDEIAMTEQSVETLRDLRANWRDVIEEEVEGEPLIENILYWLIEDMTPTPADRGFDTRGSAATQKDPGDGGTGRSEE